MAAKRYKMSTDLQQMLRATIIALANEKGGTGKTSLTALFLAILSMLGYDVLGIDMDPQGHLSLLWGYHRDTVDEGIYELLLKYSPKALREQAPIKMVIKPTYYDALGKIFDPRVPGREQLNAIITGVTQGRFSIDTWQQIEKQLEAAQKEGTSQQSLEMLLQQASQGTYSMATWQEANVQIGQISRRVLQERIVTAKRGPDILPITADASNADYAIKAKHDYWGEQLRAALQPIASHYHYIFIDCPPSIQVLTINALNAAQFVAIPLTPEVLNLEGMLGLLSVIEQAKERANPDLVTAGVILNKVQSNWNIHQDLTRDLRSWSEGLHVFETEIKQNSAVVTSMGNHSLIVLDQPESEYARAYWYLLHNLLSVIGGPAQAEVAAIVAPMKEEDLIRKQAEIQKRQLKRQTKR
jgi:cellulose biosynthesis protein BcsQ